VDGVYIISIFKECCAAIAWDSSIYKVKKCGRLFRVQPLSDRRFVARRRAEFVGFSLCNCESAWIIGGGHAADVSVLFHPPRLSHNPTLLILTFNFSLMETLVAPCQPLRARRNHLVCLVSPCIC